jgi:acyl-CoA dehydrogenase
MSLRQRWITRPLYRWARRVLPTMSETEREAIAAGDTWWEAALFTGHPDWRVLRDIPPAQLSAEERAFLDGPVNELCRMVDDWQVTWELHDLPPEAWRFMAEKKFFGMIIPKEHGGLGFSATAHSEVIRHLSTSGLTAAVTVMVPNSLGPGELLLQFGTDEQRQYWLPRLADGREIPCFGLTSAEAGSDAAAMTDTGVAAWGDYEGERVLGIRLNFRKRYITLGPVATVMGLAFKLRDPERLLGGPVELGITVALVPTHLPGLRFGERHLPAFQFFQNGPMEGDDVFVPLDAVIGGQGQIGKGWTMLMSALAAGRGISLPSLSAAASAFSARTTGAYARVREQFGVPIGKFEGVQVHLANLAATAYQLDAARLLTCAALDVGHRPAVIAAIMKAHATYRMREAVNDAMDVHAGKAIIDGPRNYLGGLYRSVPIGITVEGANILTRNLMIFGQGAIRCHPHLLKEMEALAEPDRDLGLKRFDEAFWAHVGHLFMTYFRALGRGWTGGLFAPAPAAGPVTRHYRQIARYAAAFAYLADWALITMGGSLKRREMLSARLGDILSELYLLSAVLRRWEDEGRHDADLPVVDYIAETAYCRIGAAFDAVLDNLPARWAAWLVRAVAFPLGARRRGPSDALVRACAELLLAPSDTRVRIVGYVYLGGGRADHPVAILERAFTLTVETERFRRRLADARCADRDEAVARGILSAAERDRLEEADAAVAEAIAVDSFPPEALSGFASSDGQQDAADSVARPPVDLARTG